MIGQYLGDHPSTIPQAILDIADGMDALGYNVICYQTGPDSFTIFKINLFTKSCTTKTFTKYYSYQMGERWEQSNGNCSVSDISYAREYYTASDFGVGRRIGRSWTENCIAISITLLLLFAVFYCFLRSKLTSSTVHLR